MPSPGDEYAGLDLKDELGGFVFATAVPDKQRTGWATLFYVNERQNQDAYNFTTDYPFADTGYPRVTRTTVVLRSDFEEDAAGTADPVFSDLILTDHKQIRLDDPMMDALFVGVQRVYQKIPGPVLTGTETGDPAAQGAKTTTTTQLVAANTAPDTASLSVISSVVKPIDTVKAQKETKALAQGESHPTLTSKHVDKEMNVTIPTARTIVAAGSVTPGAVILPAVTVNNVTTGPWVQVTEEQEIDKFKSYKVVSTIPQPAAKDAASAVLGTSWLAISFPARVVPSSYDVGANDITVYTPQAELVPATSRKWWVISETKPTVAVDEIVLGYTYQITSIDLGGMHTKFIPNVLHDANGFGPASTPSASEYFGYARTAASYTLTNGSSTVTGVGSHFQSAPDFTVGQSLNGYTVGAGGVGTFAVDPTKTVWVKSIESDTSMTVTADPTLATTTAYAGLTNTVPYVTTVTIGGGWVGTEKVRKANVKDVAYQKLWEVETLSVVMR